MLGKICELCGFATKTEDIEITIENIEYGKTEYSCPICEKTFKGRPGRLTDSNLREQINCHGSGSSQESLKGDLKNWKQLLGIQIFVN